MFGRKPRQMILKKASDRCCAQSLSYCASREGSRDNSGSGWETGGKWLQLGAGSGPFPASLFTRATPLIGPPEHAAVAIRSDAPASRLVNGRRRRRAMSAAANTAKAAIGGFAMGLASSQPQ